MATPVNLPNVEDQITIDFASQLGAPACRACGFIYGLSENGTQPAQNLQTAIKVRFIRAGGAQLGCPDGGFVNGQYARRWDSVRGYYARTRAIGAKFILLLHDLWGADAVCNVPRWPGDGGDWDEFIQFLNRVISDVQASEMTGADVQWDLWNEPDLLTPVQFWGRDQAQYLEMWKHAYQHIRAAIPGAVIIGPSTAGQPSPDWEWFTKYLNYVKANQVVPNYLSWHQLVPSSDPQISKANLDEMNSAYGIALRGYQVNEYGSNTHEQQAGSSVWYLGRFERDGIDALRANWGMGGGLYQGMGDLVTASGQPTASWWAYQRYAAMSGELVAVTAGAKVDGVAAIDAAEKKAIIILGSRPGIIGAVAIKLDNLPTYLLKGGETRVKVERMPEGDGSLDAPLVINEKNVAVSDHSLILPNVFNSALDAYAITVSL